MHWAKPPRRGVARGTSFFFSFARPLHVRHQTLERLACGKRGIHVHYGDGMADSRLTIPAAKAGTARNINTITKLAQLSASR